MKTDQRKNLFNTNKGKRNCMIFFKRAILLDQTFEPSSKCAHPWWRKRKCLLWKEAAINNINMSVGTFCWQSKLSPPKIFCTYESTSNTIYLIVQFNPSAGFIKFSKASNLVIAAIFTNSKWRNNINHKTPQDYFILLLRLILLLSNKC